jgi:hypothetical protein
MRLATDNLLIEIRLALLDHIELLLASSDKFLKAAGLERKDLQTAFLSQDKPELRGSS